MSSDSVSRSDSASRQRQFADVGGFDEAGILDGIGSVDEAGFLDGLGGFDSSGIPKESGAFDEVGVAKAVRALLIAVGEDPDREGLVGTPGRVASAYREIFSGLSKPLDAQMDFTDFALGHREMVLVKDIELYSICEHHLLPFHGVAHVGYIPGVEGRITGLSKLARLVEVFARRPQVQERLTVEIADALVENLKPAGVIVVLNCEHLCMSMRGVRKPGSRTVTSAVRGQMRDPATRAEAIALIGGSRL